MLKLAIRLIAFLFSIFGSGSLKGHRKAEKQAQKVKKAVVRSEVENKEVEAAIDSLNSATKELWAVHEKLPEDSREREVLEERIEKGNSDLSDLNRIMRDRLRSEKD